MVTLNVVTRRGYQISGVCEAVAVINSKDHVVQGGPALVQINHHGDLHVMTIETNALVGIIEN